VVLVWANPQMASTAGQIGQGRPTRDELGEFRNWPFYEY